MFYGRYLKVEFPEVNKTYISNYDFDENKGNAPRIAVKANLKKGAFTQGQVSLYNLTDDTVKLLESNNFSVIITAGYKIGNKRTQIIYAEKRYIEKIKIGSDVITNIYFLSGILNKKKPATIRQQNIQDLIREQCKEFNTNCVFKDNVFSNSNIQNITLTGNLLDRLNKLQSYLNFDYYEQNNQIIFTPVGRDGVEAGVFDIDMSEGLLSIPDYANAIFKVKFKIMFNINIIIGQKIRLTNKYQKISVSDENKVFSSDFMNKRISQIKDIVFRVVDINYNLDTRGEVFNIEVEGLNDNSGNS